MKKTLLQRIENGDAFSAIDILFQTLPDTRFVQLKSSNLVYELAAAGYGAFAIKMAAGFDECRKIDILCAANATYGLAKFGYATDVRDMLEDEFSASVARVFKVRNAAMGLANAGQDEWMMEKIQEMPFVIRSEVLRAPMLISVLSDKGHASALWSLIQDYPTDNQEQFLRAEKASNGLYRNGFKAEIDAFNAAIRSLTPKTPKILKSQQLKALAS